MDQVKIETQEETLPAIVANSSETLSSQDSFIKSESTTLKEWDASMELALLNAVARCKPVGIHKHFRIISVQKTFNQQSPVHCSIKEIWNRLSDYYGMDALDELEEGEEEEEEEEEEEAAGEEAGLRKQSWLREFSLPLDEYEQLISEHRQDDQSSVHDDSPASPVNPPKRTRTSKRDTSPSVSLGSAASTPEPEEGKNERSSAYEKSFEQAKLNLIHQAGLPVVLRGVRENQMQRQSR
ncbi:hypothetical protein EC973_001051 [Apophysomyces ossiformis]|uniref:Chromatin modification-related protein EAF7 n=1 Tax=Apophysomyces ossiformis TaxID=679940 RepID=A0A8H7EU16_9FUNG|nr:hypothetical protein EC973_001051 [Apophysomyces ossiformis]